MPHPKTSPRGILQARFAYQKSHPTSNQMNLDLPETSRAEVPKSPLALYSTKAKTVERPSPPPPPSRPTSPMTELTEQLPEPTPLPVALPEPTPLPVALPEPTPPPVALPEPTPPPVALPEPTPPPVALPEPTPPPIALPEPTPLPPVVHEPPITPIKPTVPEAPPSSKTSGPKIIMSDSDSSSDPEEMVLPLFDRSRICKVKVLPHPEPLRKRSVTLPPCGKSIPVSTQPVFSIRSDHLLQLWETW